MTDNNIFDINQDEKNLEENLSNDLKYLLEQIRSQQMNTDQQVQETLNQASTNLMDSKRLSNLYNDLQQLQQAAMLGIANLTTNMEQYQSTLQQMEKNCHTQQVATDMQIVSAMQQAISSMAKAQSSMLQSQSIDKLYDSITQCRDSLKQIQNLS